MVWHCCVLEIAASFWDTKKEKRAFSLEATKVLAAALTLGFCGVTPLFSSREWYWIEGGNSVYAIALLQWNGYTMVFLLLLH